MREYRRPSEGGSSSHLYHSRRPWAQRRRRLLRAIASPELERLGTPEPPLVLGGGGAGMVTAHQAEKTLLEVSLPPSPWRVCSSPWFQQRFHHGRGNTITEAIVEEEGFKSCMCFLENGQSCALSKVVLEGDLRKFVLS